LAVVCPGRERHCRSQGADGAERYCHAHAAASSTGAARWGAAQGRASGDATNPAVGSAATTEGCNVAENAARDTIRAGSGRKEFAARAVMHGCAFRTAFHSTLLPLATVIESPCLGSGGKRQALSAPSPGEPTRGPACRYLSLKFQTIQSCSPVRGPIATAVQPRHAYENVRTHDEILKNCCASRPTLQPLAMAFQDSFSIDFAFRRGRWRRPCVKYRF
jgi:hypothetical protein